MHQSLRKEWVNSAAQDTRFADHFRGRHRVTHGLQQNYTKLSTSIPFKPKNSFTLVMGSTIV